MTNPLQLYLQEVVHPLYEMPSFGKLRRLSIEEHFTRQDDGLAGVSGVVSGTGAAVNNIASPAGRFGVISCETGSTTTGDACVRTDDEAFRCAGGRIRFRADTLIPTASDGTNTFTVRVGLHDFLSADGTNGIYFRYAHGTNSGNWVCVTRAASTETTTNSSVAGAGSTYNTFEIEINAAGTSVTFWINGSAIATHTTNIPTAVLGVTPGRITKSAGTTSREVRADMLIVSFEPTVAL